MNSIQVGFSQTVITPQESAGHILAGYIRRRGRSVGVHDDIHAKILILDIGEVFVLVSLDLLGVDEKLYLEVSRLVENKLGKTNLVVAGTHTHSAPASAFTSPFLTFSWDAFQENYFSELLASVEQGIQRALEGAAPASLAVAETFVEGVATDRSNPGSVIDNSATLVLLRKATGESCALLHFAVHPTVLGPDNLLISRDLVGYAVDEVAKGLGLEMCLFVNGAAANVSTRFTRRAQSFEEAERLGKLLAEQVIASAGELRWVSCSFRAGEITRRVKLLDPSEKLSEAREMLGHGRYDGRVREAVIEGVELLEALSRARNFPEAAEVRVTGLCLGDLLSLVAFPFEMPSDFALQLKRALSPTSLVVSYANGYYGYLAPAGVQGYERIFELVPVSEKEELLKAAGLMLQGLASDTNPRVRRA